MARIRHSEEGRSAFTIVELLVSIAVLVLIMVMVSQLMNSAAISTTMSGKHMDTDSQARMVFDRMAVDFSHMPRRKDIDFIFAKETAGSSTTGSNDKMFFYSEAPAFFDTSVAALYPNPASSSPDPKSSVALVGYMINPGIDNGGVTPSPYCLQRLSKGLVWDAQTVNGGASPGGMVFLTFPTNTTTTPISLSTLAGNPCTTAAIGTPPLYSGTDPSFDVLADQVFRMEFCFQVKDLSNPSAPGSAYSNYPVAYFKPGSTNQATESTSPPSSANGGDRWYDLQNNRAFVCTGISGGLPTWAPNGLADVSAIVVTIATLDTNSRKVITPAQLGALSEALADPPDSVFSQNPYNPPLMAQTWEATVDNSDFASTVGVAASVAGQVRIYQRFFDLIRN